MSTFTTPKSRFVVVDENMLCIVYPARPLSGQILAASVVRGAVCTWHDGTYPLPLDPDWVRSDDCPKPLNLARVNAGLQPVKLDPAHVRAATRADFDTFRLHTGGYETDPAIDFPRN